MLKRFVLAFRYVAPFRNQGDSVRPRLQIEAKFYIFHPSVKLEYHCQYPLVTALARQSIGATSSLSDSLTKTTRKSLHLSKMRLLLRFRFAAALRYFLTYKFSRTFRSRLTILVAVIKRGKLRNTVNVWCYAVRKCPKTSGAAGRRHVAFYLTTKYHRASLRLAF